MIKQEQTNKVVNNKRIAKNTIILYMRTLFTMIVSLYTSRIVLNALGVDNYGIYNVVGGFVGMLSILSGSLSSSISRYITFALGKGNFDDLKRIFSTSVIIQSVMAIVVIIVGEIVGTWFLNTHLNIPSERLAAANWVYQCSLCVFVFNILYVPYNACIIAHEKMTAFAYVGIFDVVLKLLIAYAIKITSSDKLILYSILLLCQSILLMLIYMVYSRRKFKECQSYFILDKTLLRNMTGFAGWTFLTGGAAVFNTQGLNVLINMFFGVAMNAARGIASQIESVIMRFVNDFTTAINPQITKSYAVGDMMTMTSLVCRGAKFSFFLLFVMVLPFMFEAEMIIRIWLKVVPDHTVAFFRLSMIGMMVNVLGNTGYTACMATGEIKKYTLIITSIGCLVFPLTWLTYYLGYSVEACYLIYILVYIIILFVRLGIMKELLNFEVIYFLKSVIVRVILVCILSLSFPLLVYYLIPQGYIRLFLSTLICVISATMCIYYIGLSKSEKTFVNEKIRAVLLSKHETVCQ